MTYNTELRAHREIKGIAEAQVYATVRCDERVHEGRVYSSKEKVCRRLAHDLNGKYMYSPPFSLAKERAFFDKQPELVKRAFYTLAHYIVAARIKEETAIRPAISTRGWYHDTTFALAEEYIRNSSSLPPPDSSLYMWPGDLFVPDIAFYLAFSYRERYLSRTFRQAVELVYTKMKNPSVLTIGYCNTNSDVFDKIVTELNRTCGSMLYNKFGQLKHMV